MALEGITFTTWFGWLAGIIFLGKPWGCPYFPTWISKSLLLFIFNFGVFFFLSLDAMINFRQELVELFLAGGESRVLSVVNRASVLELLVSNVLIRLVFIFQANNLAKLWGKLYIWNHGVTKGKTFSFGYLVNVFVVSLSVILNLTLAIYEGWPIGSNFQKSWIGPIGYIPFVLMHLFFLAGGLVLPGACGFAAVLGTLHHLRWAYEEYCSKIRGLMERKSKCGKGQPFSGILTPEMKVKLVEEFEEIQEMFNWWDSSLAPVLLVIMSGGSLRLVCTAAKLFLKSSGSFVGWEVIKEVAHLIICACQLYSLEAGENILNTFADWREKLQKESLKLVLFHDSKEAVDLNDLYLLIDNWRWNLSASGFFDVDRKLASGIISSMVTYVVILVQIKISLEGA